MDNLGFGLGVALAGLGIVFGLLVVLWLLLTVALRLDRRAVSPPTPSTAYVAGGRRHTGRGRPPSARAPSTHGSPQRSPSG